MKVNLRKISAGDTIVFQDGHCGYVIFIQEYNSKFAMAYRLPDFGDVVERTYFQDGTPADIKNSPEFKIVSFLPFTTPIMYEERLKASLDIRLLCDGMSSVNYWTIQYSRATNKFSAVYSESADSIIAPYRFCSRESAIYAINEIGDAQLKWILGIE